MSMRVLLALSLTLAGAVGTRPLAAEDGQVVAPRVNHSDARWVSSGRPGPIAVPDAGASDDPNAGPIADPNAGSTTRPRDRDAPPAGRAVWRWPLEPRPVLLREFTAPPNPYGPGHRGLDLGSPAGTEVAAVAAGEVTHAGRVAGRGTVTVAHSGGLSSTYEPVDPSVGEGDRVEAGDPLGVLEPVGTVTGHCAAVACLHLGARRGPVYLDPLPLLLGGRIVLLPLAGTPRQPDR